MMLLGVMLVPITVAAVGFFLLQLTITWKEFLLQLAVACLLVLGCWQIAKYGALRDTEHLNGRITAKRTGTESCCHCTTVCDSTDSKGNCTSSHEECDHVFDHWWALDTTAGRIMVEDCDGMGFAPKAWDDAYVDEPAVIQHGYTNYLKADPDSLLVKEDHSAFLPHVPKFPSVYGVYHVNPVLADRTPIPRGWQERLREINADLGPAREVDITVLLTAAGDPRYADAVEAKWLYGPKNSLNVVLGIKGNTVIWAKIVTLSRVEDLKISLRDELRGMSLDGTGVLDTIGAATHRQFKRTPMSEYEYLARSAQPRGWWLFGLYALALFLSCGLTYYMHMNDVFGEEGFRGGRRGLSRLRRRNY